MNTKIIFFLCMLFGLSQSPQAAENLFYAEAEIESESAQARQVSIANAFHKVLIKLTGNSKIKAQKGVSGLLKKSADYVSQFSYRVIEVNNDQQPDGGATETKRMIQIQFDQHSVKRALAAAGIAIWEGSRPEVLLWSAYKQRGKPRLLDGETLPRAIPLLQQAAENRGLQLQLPLMDLQDQAALSAGDVWTDNGKIIQQASSRYPNDVILTARITGTEGGKWQASWIMYQRDERKEFSRKGENLQRTLERGMNRAADLLAQSYAPVATAEANGAVNVHILGVGNAGDYARVMDLIRQQSGVSRLSMKQMQADELLLEVWVAGGVQALANGLSLGGELAPVADADTQGKGLIFRLNH